MGGKPRRRVHRPSVSTHYDRTADRPTEPQAPQGDDDRVVLMDDEEEPLIGLEFWLNQQPPHYGGNI